MEKQLKAVKRQLYASLVTNALFILVLIIVLATNGILWQPIARPVIVAQPISTRIATRTLAPIGESSATPPETSITTLTLEPTANLAPTKAPEQLTAVSTIVFTTPTAQQIFDRESALILGGTLQSKTVIENLEYDFAIVTGFSNQSVRCLALYEGQTTKLILVEKRWKTLVAADTEFTISWTCGDYQKPNLPAGTIFVGYPNPNPEYSTMLPARWLAYAPESEYTSMRGCVYHNFSDPGRSVVGYFYRQTAEAIQGKEGVNKFNNYFIGILPWNPLPVGTMLKQGGIYYDSCDTGVEPVVFLLGDPKLTTGSLELLRVRVGNDPAQFGCLSFPGLSNCWLGQRLHPLTD